MSIEDVQDFADKYPTGFMGEATYISLNAAIDGNFIDGVKSYPEFREHMIEKFGLDENSDRETYPNISYQEYMDTFEIEKDSADDKVAVVTVEGTITRGEIQPGVAGADGLARLLRSAHEDEDVKALVVRVNSGGTILSKSDLLFSTIVANWLEGRQEIEELLKTINKEGDGFSFDNDFIMRSCLVLTDCPVLFKVRSFKRENINRIKDQWKDIKTSIIKTVDLLVEFGFNSENLTSQNAVIPIAYYFMKGGNDRKDSKNKYIS
jgi:hypothetical protein